MAKKQVTKLIINVGTADGKTEKIILEGDAKSTVYGLKVGDEFDGDLLGSDYKGYRFVITGGSDKDGFPLRKDFDGIVHYRPLLAGSVGYRPKRKGIRRRKRVRGSEIQDDVTQLNCKLIKAGKTPLSSA
jgi:small subunit ribosomal protein S6e